jgi:hypothetical protein
VKCKGDLSEVIAARRTPRCFTSRLYGGQQERDQNANNGNDDEQLDQRKAAWERGRSHDIPSQNRWRKKDKIS